MSNRLFAIVLMIHGSNLSVGGLAADDAIVNTPVVVSSLKGEWELQPKAANDYKQRISFDGSRCGEWRQSKESLPVSITFYVEGEEIVLQHYYQPKEPFNYRLKQLRYRYKLDSNTLILTKNGQSEIWRRVKTTDSK